MRLFALLYGCTSPSTDEGTSAAGQIDRVDLTPAWTPEELLIHMDLLMTYGLPNPYPIINRYTELYDEGGTPACPGTNYNFDGVDVDNAGCETEAGYFYAGLGELRETEEGFDLHCDCRIVTPDGRMIRGAGNISIFNDDGSLDLSDAVNLLDFLFTGGGAPEAPFPLAGLDPTPDSLGCDAGCDDVTCGSGFPGDECISALTVTIGGNEFDTSLMTDSSDAYDNTGCESTFLGQMYADIWLDFTAPVSGVASFSLCTEDVEFDSDMVIYSGSCGQLVQEACNGDGVDEFGEPCPLLTSRISDFPVNQGDHYFIRVGGFDSVSQVELGPGVLTITID